jgi:ligand-binding sensor domain-containing protein/signal transduction histidine kinase
MLRRAGRRTGNPRVSRLIRFTTIIAPLLFCAVGAAAQYRFDSWTADNGLPQNSVYSIQQTPDGYLWLTTLDGLVRFDGVEFTIFNKSNSKNLITNRFTNLFADTDGTLWLGTEESGLARFRNGHFQTFTAADGLPSSEIRQIQRDLDGSLLISTTHGLARFRDGHFSIEREIDSRTFNIYVSPSGTRWEMDKNGLRAVGKNGRAARYDLPFAAQDISSDRTFNYFSFVPMFEDSEGALWFAASGSLFKLKDGAIKAFTAKDGAPDSRVRSLIQDRAGAIWLGTEKDGVCRFGENRFACFGTSDGLSSNHVMNLFFDREGTLWVGTNERGVNRVTPRVVASVSVAEGLAGKNVYPILEDKTGGVWIGSFSGLSYYKNGEITNYTRRDGLLYEIVQSLFEDGDGRLWIGSVGGVEYLENGKFIDFTEKLGLPYGDFVFFDIHQDRAGAMWFATKNGLVKYEGGAAKILTAADGLPSDDVKTIHEARDGGTLWLGTSRGLAVLSSDFSRFSSDGGSRLKSELKTFTENNGLAGNVRTIYEDGDGALWIGTYDSGLSRFKNGKFTNYTTAEGLFSNGVFQILEDGRGNFWMSSNQGIYRVNKQQLNDFADGKISAVTSTVFGKSDGILNIECNGGRQPAGIKTADGKFWFPTQDGAAIINPEAVPFNPLAPPVVIESAFLEGAKVELTDKLEIQPDQDNLEIRYTGLSFIKPEQVQFKYKLEGFDEDWTNAGTRREAYYPYLPPGKYTFRVIAANSDNVWNEQGASLSIVVNPPFYNHWLFIAACLAVFVAGVYGIYRYRVAQVERGRRAQEDFSRRLINAHEAERQRIAAELHDSIGQTLAMIKNRAAFGSQSDDNTAAKEQLEAIGAQTTQAIGEVREISYNLRPYLLENLGLTKAIKSLVKKIEEVHLVIVDAQIDDVDDLFAPEAEMSVYRIVQESLNNVAKHAEADAAVLRIEKTNGVVTIKIEDDGRGFDPHAPPKTDAETGGFGLLGIAERVRMLGGVLDIQTAIGSGTRLTIKIKVSD